MSDTTKQYWMEVLAQTTKAFNLCANMAVEQNIPLGIKSFHDNLYDVIRQNFPIIPAQGAIKVYKEVLSALRSRKSNKHFNGNIPQRKKLALHLDKRMYSKLSKEGIALSSGVLNKRELCTFNLYDKVIELFDTCSTADPLLFARDGKIYLSVPFEVSTPPCTNDEALGVDLGVRRLFVTSEGNSFVDKRYLKRRRELRYLKRCLQSNGSRSAKKHLRTLSQKEYHMSKDMQHRAAKALIESTSASHIILEDLKNLKQTTSKTSEGHKRTKHNRVLSQVPFASFKDILTHKAQLVGKQVETVSPTWTSQTDSRTNKRDGERCGCRYYCSDGVVLDADWNAAVNIANRANHPKSSCLPIDGGLKPLLGWL